MANSKSKNQNQPDKNKAPIQSDNFYPDILLFNKQSGKKITGAKVPNWKSLSLFLEKNSQIFIDPSCTETLKAKFGRNVIPDIIKSRLINQSKNKLNNVNTSNQRGGSNTSTSSPPPSNKQSSSSALLNNNNKNKEDEKKNSKLPQMEQPMFNPFSPSSNAQLQGLTDLLGAAAAAGDFNNPLASFMAAMAAQNGNDPSATLPFGGLGAGTSGSFNPFLLPPFAPPPSNSSTPPFNPLLADIFKDFGNKMPNGFDMNSLEDFALSLTAGMMPQSSVPSIKSSAHEREQSNNSNKSRDDHKNINKNQKDTSESNKDNRKRTPQASTSSSSNSDRFDRNNRTDRSERNERSEKIEHSERNVKSKESRNSSNNNNNRDNGNIYRPPSTSSTISNSSKITNASEPKSSKDSKPQSSNNNNNNNNKNKKKPSNENNSSRKDRNNESNDPNVNAAIAASMMEQEKFMQEMMNLSQFASGFPNNPFFFGAPNPSFPTPPVPSLITGKSNRHVRSPSPSNGRERSISPASSIASNISQQQQSLDFNLFMNNLMNYQMMGGAPGAGVGSFQSPLHPPLMPGLPGMSSDLSKLPADFLSTLAAAASQSGGMGMGGLDPSLFSALAQLNSLSNNVNEEEQKESSQKSKHSSSSASKPSSSRPSGYHGSNSNGSSSQNKNMQQTSSAKTSSSIQKPSSSSGSSSSKQSNSMRQSGSSNHTKKSSDDVYQGLDLSVKKQMSRHDYEESKLSKLKQSSRNH